MNQRFHADPHVEPGKAASLYEKWISTAFNDPKQKVLVLDVEENPVGFMVYQTRDLTSYFGLRFAVWKMALLDPACRGKGFGNDLFRSLLRHHRDEGLDIVDSCLTLSNVPSLNLHNKRGFKIISSDVTFHKWCRDAGGRP